MAMQRLIVVCVLSMLCLPLRAQTDNTRCSANLMQWLSSHDEEKPNAYDVSVQQHAPMVSLLIKVHSDVDESEFSRMGAVVGTKAGNIWTIRIPSSSVRAFTNVHGIEYMELAPTVRAHMDSARYYANVDSAMNGVGIPKPLSGKGVVVGVIDGGFDYTNPAFYDTTYSKLRITKAWVQDVSGTPPAGYSYGAEFADTASLLLKQFDLVDGGSHGNACAAIAAGSGLGSANPRRGRGLAYESELIFVSSPLTYLDWREVNMASIIDGINYVFSSAEAQGKPAVVNISMGSLVGARDGESLFAQACDNLSGPGKILVFGAGNQRGVNCHFGKTFSATDTVVRTLVPIDEVDSSEHRNYIDVWGDSLKTFCLRFGLYRNGVVTDSSMVYCMDNSTQQFSLVRSDNDTCFITLTTKKQDYNTRSHATIDVFCTSADTLCISVYAHDGSVHMWQEYFDESWVTYWGEFVGNSSWASAGDDNFTIGEMGCTKSAITVGASVSKVYFRNLMNQTLYVPPNTLPGKLASYSGKGPTFDNRIKPNIVAPGGLIAASQNSFDVSAVPGGALASLLVSQYTSPNNGRTYYHAVGQGTSYATPMVTGVVALMLQVNPRLTPQAVQTILSRTATLDNHTTTDPDASLWGAGKLNGYAAVKETIATSGTVEIAGSEGAFNVYPHPIHGKFTIEYESDLDGYVWIEVKNLIGQTVSQQPWQLTIGTNTIPVELQSAGKGLHMVSIIDRGRHITKLVVLE